MEQVRNFQSLLERQWMLGNFVCVGLDSVFEKIPKFLREIHGQFVADTIFAFNRDIVDATHQMVCAYKLNAAFYEAYGDAGLRALSETFAYIRSVAPNVPVIFDAKRGDIGNTNDGYATSAFDLLHADALTVNPYLGSEAMKPFLDKADKGIIVLCRTSNPGAGELQDMMVDGKPLYQRVAEKVVANWNSNGNCAVVVGATYPKELEEVRKIAGDMTILIPGIGAQGGDIESTVRAGKNSKKHGMIINSSRDIIYASSGEDFADKAQYKVIQLSNSIRAYL